MNSKDIINNAFLKIEIINHLKKNKNPMTEDQFELYCKEKDLCIGIVSKIKVSPYYFNKSGTKLAYQFLDIDTGIMKHICNTKTGKVINKNIQANKITWG